MIEIIMKKLSNKAIIKKSFGFGFLFGAIFSFIIMFLMPLMGFFALDDSGSFYEIIIFFAYLFYPASFCTRVFKKLMSGICIPGNQPAYCPVECGLGGGLLSLVLVYGLIGSLIVFLILKYKQRKT